MGARRSPSLAIQSRSRRPCWRLTARLLLSGRAARVGLARATPAGLVARTKAPDPVDELLAHCVGGSRKQRLTKLGTLAGQTLLSALALRGGRAALATAREAELI